MLFLTSPIGVWGQQDFTEEYDYPQPVEEYYELPVNTAIDEEVTLKPFDEEALDDLRNTFDYTKPAERKKKEQAAEEEARRERERNQEPLSSGENNWEIGELKIPAWLGWLILTLLLGVIGFFVYRALGVIDGPVKKKTKTADRMRADLSEVPEEELTLQETETLLQRAERTGDFTTAVRLQYLAMLKELNDLRLIEYKRDKTDREYRREMDETELGDEFAAITIDYARNWYGQYPLDRLSYRLVAGRFESLRGKLSSVKRSAYA